MFSHLGRFIARHWILVILGWVVLCVGLKLTTPAWDEVTYDGDLAHLPAEVGSLQGAKLLDKAFPKDRSKSKVVLIVARDNGPLVREDMVLTKRLAQAMKAMPVPEGQRIVNVLTTNSPVVGELLKSRDEQARLVVLQMSGEFMATTNIKLLENVIACRDETVAAYEQELVKEKGQEFVDAWRENVEVGIAGSAATGGDMLTSAAKSIKNTETATLLLVMAILLVVYRAPLLVLIPLTTIAVSVTVAMSLVAAATQVGLLPGFDWWDFKVFKTTKIFIVVILYGAGTDYCLFLISRYKEELARGLSRSAAAAEALGQVGEALAASALTTIIGLSMMYFAAFGKYSSSGPAIALCLCVALAACVTLAPALLRAFGRVVFWPLGHKALGHEIDTAESSQSATPISATANAKTTNAQGEFQELTNHSMAGVFWNRLTSAVMARPGLILIVAVAMMSPLAYLGVTETSVTYDFLAELEEDCVSVQGAKLVRQHFPSGETDPITIIAQRPDTEFDTNEGKVLIGKLVDELNQIDSVIGIRSLATIDGKKRSQGADKKKRKKRGILSGGFSRRVKSSSQQAKESFVSNTEENPKDVTLLYVTLTHDPFTAEAIHTLDQIVARLDELSDDPESQWHGARFLWVGTTAGIRDLRAVTESDKTLIQQLVVLAVLMVLLVILRRPVVCVYLILSVLFSYFVTIGITQLVFQNLYGDTFHGLDWKVPLFLFVILIAVGEDYNIYLATRVFEEQDRLGPRKGLRYAVVQTGGIITSCGVIMAGTFVSMMFGSLRGMTELGFALSLGVLLDTFVIRTILVPAFFALILPKEERKEPEASESNISANSKPSPPTLQATVEAASGEAS